MVAGNPIKEKTIKEIKAEARAWQAKLTEACKTKHCPAILEVYNEWRSAVPNPPTCIYPQTLNGLMADNVTGLSAEEVAVHADAIFESSRQVVKPNESILSLMIRMTGRLEPSDDAVARGQKYLRMIDEAGLRPKLRTFLPLFEMLSVLARFDEVEELYAKLVLVHRAPQNSELTPSRRCEDDDLRLWEDVMAFRLRVWKKANKSTDLRDRILRDICELCPRLSGSSQLLSDTLIDTFNGIDGWTPGWTTVNPQGLCSSSKRTLRRIALDEQALLDLRQLITRLACEGTRQRNKEEWEKWVKQADDLPFWDAVIDGANVGHHNQNWEHGAFNFDQIDDVVNELEKQGKKVCVVLRRHWLETQTELNLAARNPKKRKRLPQLDDNEDRKQGAQGDTKMNEDAVEEPVPELRAIAHKWAERGNLLISPPSLNDDWVVMYICITMTIHALRKNSGPTYLVSNDLMRDHYWRMRQHSSLLLWREAHLMHYRIIYPERHIVPDSTARVLELLSPLPFSPRSQCSVDDTSWHFALPGKDDKNGEKKDDDGEYLKNWRWIVAYR